MASEPDFPALLTRLLRTDAGRPLLTHYDHATGERTELSVTTWANWVAKVAGLLTEELELERGDRLAVDLPPHWLGPVMLGAAWSVGLEVVVPGEEADLVVTGPDGLERWAGGTTPVLASALHPLGMRFAEALPAGVVDLGVEVWSQPDSFIAFDPPTGADAALAGRTQAELLARAGSDRRLLSSANPLDAGLETWLDVLVGGGSLVLVRHPDEAKVPDLAAAERAEISPPC